MAAVEQAVQADLEALGHPVRRSALAFVALHLAQRLDGEPSDREASTLARELRLTLQELHRLAALDDEEGGLDVSAAEMGD